MAAKYFLKNRFVSYCVQNIGAQHLLNIIFSLRIVYSQFCVHCEKCFDRLSSIEPRYSNERRAEIVELTDR